MTTPNTSPQTVGTAPSITEFLLARIAEDDVAPSEPDEYIEGFCDLNDGTHYSGDRIVAECAAKRAIVKLHRETEREGYVNAAAYLSDSLHALAAVYASHPDYRQEWAL